MARFEPPQLKNRLFNTTTALWRLCDRFPQEDHALVKRVRERALNVLDDATRYFHVRTQSLGLRHELLRNLVSEIDALQTMMHLARIRNHIQEVNFLMMDWEYEQLLELLSEDLAAHDALFLHNGANGLGNDSVNGFSNNGSLKSVPTGANGKNGHENPHNGYENSKTEENHANGDFFSGLSSRQKRIYEFFLRNKRAKLQDLLQAVPDVSDRTLRTDLTYLLSLGLIERVGVPPHHYYQVLVGANGSQSIGNSAAAIGNQSELIGSL